jgi:8-oxo-dGTP pyrophosphatase MutT (NUDIX family)
MTNTYFQGDHKHPQHISVGAILLNGKKEVCCHRLQTKNLRKYLPDEKDTDLYILMRETIHPNESLEEAVHRGLMEEFGVTAKLVDYVGSIESKFKDHGVEVQKTTLYFLCSFISQDITKRKAGDIEAESDIEWKNIDELILIMKKQAELFERTDADESPILERLKTNY